MAKQYYDKINTCFKRELDHNSPLYNCILPQESLTTPELDCLRKENFHFEATEKVDGECTSIHLIPILGNLGVMDYKIEVHGKTDSAQMRVDEVELLQNIGDQEKLVDCFTRITPEGKPVYPESEIIIFGETYGKKMQKNGSRYDANKLKFICFDVKVGDIWLLRKDVEDVCTKLNIDIVPIIGYYTIDEAIDVVSKGLKSTIADDKELDMEGLVLRTPCGLLDRQGKRIITKIKTKDFRDLEHKTK